MKKILALVLVALMVLACTSASFTSSPVTPISRLP